MKVSFIIPLYNCLPLTRAMLASLQTTLPAGLEHEIIFVDDGSTDGTRDWLAALPPPCRALLNERNLGFAATCNRGAATATGEFLFFLNNDLVLLPGWFEPMLAIFARRPRAGLVGNVQLNHATGRVDHAGIDFDHKGKPTHRTWTGPRAAQRVDAATGACLAVRREAWDRLAGFDAGFVNGCEDVDLCLRAREAGWETWIALRSKVRHHVSASAGRKLRDEQNTAKLHARWHAFILTRIARRCSIACLQASWDEPRNYADRRLVLAACLYLLGPDRSPPASLLTAARASLQLEGQRWAHLLDGAPLRPVREVAWQFFPVIPEDPPVI